MDHNANRPVLRDEEDGPGLVKALEMSKHTTGEAPDAMTRDGNVCHCSHEVESALEADRITSVPATPDRGQSKAPTTLSLGLS